jgi:wobble nucleotide-excising tRNase
MSLLFESLKGSNELVNKKKNINSLESPEILLIGQDNSEVKFVNGQWNKYFEFIEVFNSFYFEDNVYKISPSKNLNDVTSIRKIFGLEKLAAVKQNLRTLKRELSDAGRAVNETELILRRKKKEGVEDIEPYVNNFENAKNLTSVLNFKIKDVIYEQANEPYKEELASYKNHINSYLTKFSNNINIKSISILFHPDLNQIRHLVYDIEVSGKVVEISDRSEASLKYFLSDGDKNALSLSFFLAKFDLIENSDEFIVVVDDPFTSFDSHRKLMTVKELIKLSDKVHQLYILTHDLHFAKEFLQHSRKSILTLQIVRINGDSVIKHIDIENELLSGLMRDITTLHKFLIEGSENSNHRIQVARCIRPSIEGLFRIKFYNDIRPTEWLGDFIAYIRESEQESPFYRLKQYVSDIEIINDFSKGFHHSNSLYEQEQISESELRSFVQQTLQLIQKI